MTFPLHRPRRLRATASLRKLVRETRLLPSDFVLPLFTTSEPDVERPIAAMPGTCLWSGRRLVEHAKRVRDAGVPAVLLFGVARPDEKDGTASSATGVDGPVQLALSLLREAVPELVRIADVCLCEYKSDGHCGVLVNGRIDNDETNGRIAEVAVAYARAGAQVVAPSGMMDGMVLVIRRALDAQGYQDVAIMPYSAKFASALYGPFKAGTQSNPEVSLHATHQMDVANGREALREVARDVEEGADALIIKPAMPFLDVVTRAREACDLPIAAYQVSGELAMIESAAERGAFDRRAILEEALLSIKRAGADMIITYAAIEAASFR
jgi:porphobilinogen synthase